MTLSGYTLWRTYWRSFFIQAGFSQESLQTLGLLYAVEPALRELYPAPEAFQGALKRHLLTFNTHPYVSAAIIGGVLHHEVRIARGEEPPEAVTRYKQTLMGPLAALGDGFFWLSLRPAAGALAVALVPFIDGWAALVFLGLYNAVHLSARGTLFLMGWRLGDGIVAKLSKVPVPSWGQRLRGLAAMCSGAVAAWLAVRFGGHAHGLTSPVLAGACLLFGAAAGSLAQRRVSPYVLLYALAAMAVAVGASV